MLVGFRPVCVSRGRRSVQGPEPIAASTTKNGKMTSRVNIAGFTE
jgi:hypothetical protein